MSMTKNELREHYAGLAMQAIITGTLSWSDGFDNGHARAEPSGVAVDAFAYADALLAELEKGGSDE